MNNKVRVIALLTGLVPLLLSPTPGVAQELAVQVTSYDLATLTDTEGLSVSPDGTRAVFQLRRPLPETNSYDLAWYVVPTAGGVPRRIADGGLPVLDLSTTPWPWKVNGAIGVAPPVWSRDSQWIVYVRRDAAGTQLWRTRVDGTLTEQLTHTAAEAGGYTLILSGNRIVPDFGFSSDDRRLYFKTKVSEAQLAAALIEEGRTGYLFDDDRFNPGASPYPRAPRGAALRLGRSGNLKGEGPPGHALWVYELATGRERPATPDETKEHAALADEPNDAPAGVNMRRKVVSSPGGSLAWAEARDPKLQGAEPPLTVVAQPKRAAAPIVCKARVCTSQILAPWRWRNDSELLFKAAAADGSTRLDERTLYAWRPGRDKEPRLVLRTTGMYDDWRWDCGQAHDKLICFYEELDRPRRLVSIDLDSGAIETLYDPNPTWARFDLGKTPQAIQVRTQSGFEMHSYLVLPPGHQAAERLPLVVVGYVCNGFLRGGSGNEYPVYPLAAQGFAVLCHNMMMTNWEAVARGPNPMPSEFSEGDGDGFRELIQAGLDAAIDRLDGMGVIDPDRVGVTGLSAGAQMVEYAIIHRPRLAAAIESGTMFEAAIMSFCGFGACEMLRGAGFGSPTSERWKTRAMSRNADRIRTPLLINASDQEMLDSVEPVRALQAAGRAAELYVYPDEHHIKWQPAHRLSVYSRNIDWLNFWLRGVENSAPAKAAQYERWRAMRVKQCERLNGEEAPWYCRQGPDPSARQEYRR